MGGQARWPTASRRRGCRAGSPLDTQQTGDEAGTTGSAPSPAPRFPTAHHGHCPGEAGGEGRAGGARGGEVRREVDGRLSSPFSSFLISETSSLPGFPPVASNPLLAPATPRSPLLSVPAIPSPPLSSPRFASPRLSSPLRLSPLLSSPLLSSPPLPSPPLSSPPLPCLAAHEWR
jgi:hypothetical protein